MLVRIHSDIVDRCRIFANDSVAETVNKGVKDLYSKGALRSDDDYQIRYSGRLAEVAVCLCLSIPVETLMWDTTLDKGYDIKMDCGLTIDVKSSTHPKATKLIWPVKKMHKLQKAADILVFCRVNTNIPEIDVAGWVYRDEFIERAKTAKFVKGLVDGTRYMEVQDLNKISDLPRETCV